MARIGPYVELLHPAPVLAVLVAATVFASAGVGAVPALERLGPFLAALLLTQIAISLHNDYCDRDLDAVEKPWRLIPSGRLRPATALRLAVVSFVLGLVAAAPLGAPVVGLVAAGTVLGFAYNAGLKRSVWSWVPFSIALPTLALCAALVAGRFDARLLSAYLIGAPLAVAIHLADTLEDIESDARRGLRGLAHRLGARGARVVCWALLALGMGLAAWSAPFDRIPAPLLVAALGLLCATVAVGLRSVGRLHWTLVVGVALVAGVAWFSAILW